MRCFILILLAALSSGPAAFSQTVLIPAPPLTPEQARAYSQNLARAHLVTEIKQISGPATSEPFELSVNDSPGRGTVQSLISDDETIAYRLPAGKSEYLITLKDTRTVSKLTFLNVSASGQVSVAVADNQVALEKAKSAAKPFTQERAVTISLPDSPAKYVKIAFDAPTGGQISGLGIFGPEGSTGYTVRPKNGLAAANMTRAVPPSEYINYDYANLRSRSRIAYVSSGSHLNEAYNMIDDNPETGYIFDPKDPAPIAVIELAESSEIQRVTSAYSKRPGRMEVYTLNEIPGITPPSPPTLIQNTPADPGFLRVSNPLSGLLRRVQNAGPEIINLPPSFFNDVKPIASVNSTDPVGQGAVNFKLRPLRYLLLRWMPAAPSETPFVVLEVNAFGNVFVRDLDALPDDEVPIEGTLAPIRPPDISPPNDPPKVFDVDPPVVSP
jgi:hypothetical protein